MHNWIHLFEFDMCLCNKYSTVNNFNKPTYDFTLCTLNNVLDFCYHLLIFFKSKITFSKNLIGTRSECQMVCIQIKTEVLLVLNWV